MDNGVILFYFAHFFGIISSFFYLYSDFQEDDIKLDKFYTIGNVFFLFHLLLLKSFIPSITIFFAIIRNTLNRIYENNNYLKYTFVLIFSFIFLLSIFYFKEWQLSLPAFVSLVMTFAFLYTKGNLLTFLIAFCSILWLIVGIHIDSYAIIFIEIMSIILLSYRYFKQNNLS